MLSLFHWAQWRPAMVPTNPPSLGHWGAQVGGVGCFGVPAGVSLLALPQQRLGQGAGRCAEVEHGRHRLDQLVGLRLQGAKALQFFGHIFYSWHLQQKMAQNLSRWILFRLSALTGNTKYKHTLPREGWNKYTFKTHKRRVAVTKNDGAH